MPGKKYVVEGITLIQEPLVLGQLQRLGDMLESTTFDLESGGASILKSMGANGPLFLAHVLRVDGVPWKDHRPEEITYLTEAMQVTQAIEVIEDFFDLNVVSDLVKRVGSLGTKIFPARSAPPAS